MFEGDDDLGLDEDFCFTPATVDSDIVGPSNCELKTHFERSDKNIFLETNARQTNELRTTTHFPSSPVNNKNVNQSVFNSGERRIGGDFDIGKASTSSRARFEFKRPGCLKKSGVSTLESSQKSGSSLCEIDCASSDVFTQEVTFDTEQRQPVKKPRVAQQTTPTKRKFPGPAGVLPESSKPSKSFYENADGENSTIIDIPLTGNPCTQDNSQFSGQLWMRMCADFSGGRVFLPDCYNIAWIKKNADAKIFHNHKAPFLSAVIVHLEQFTSKTPNVIVTLKDSSGRINASLHSDLYDLHKQDLTVGSVIVLRDFSVLTIINSGNVYLTITKRNLLTIYSQASLRNSATQNNEYTQVVRSAPKVTSVQNYNLSRIIDDTLGYNNNFQHEDSTRKDLLSEFGDDDDVFSEKNLIEMENNDFIRNKHVENTTSNTGTNSCQSNGNSNIINTNQFFNSCTKNTHTRPKLNNLTRTDQSILHGNNHDINLNKTPVEKHYSKERLNCDKTPLENNHLKDGLNKTSLQNNHSTDRIPLESNYLRDQVSFNENNTSKRIPEETRNENPFEDCDFDEDEDVIFTECDEITPEFNKFGNALSGGNHRDPAKRAEDFLESITNETTIMNRAKLNPGKLYENDCDSKRLAVKKRLDQFKFKKRTPEKDTPCNVKSDKENVTRKLELQVDESVMKSINEKSGVKIIGSKVTQRAVNEFSSQISITCENEEHSQILEETFDGVDANSFFDEF